MARSGAATRRRILKAAEALVFEHGFAATSIDRVLARAGVTKGAFFHHFKSKADLGRALVAGFAARDRALLDDAMGRAEGMTRDPLDQLLGFVGLLQETASRLAAPAPGSLFAAAVYERRELPEDIGAMAAAAMLAWRARLGAKIEASAARHPPRREVVPASLAEHLTVILEGGYVLAKALDDPGLLARHIGHYRSYLEAAFGRAPG